MSYVSRVTSWLGRVMQERWLHLLAASSPVFAALWLWKVKPGGSARRLELGSLSEAIAAGVGTIALVVLIRNEHRDRQEALELEREKAQTERRAQASRVTAWAVDVTSITIDASAFMEYEIRLRNASESAIYSHSILLSPDFDSPWAAGWGDDLGAVGPGETLTHQHRVPSGPGEEHPWPPPIALLFTDGAGRSWMRSPDGRLTEQPARRRPTARWQEPPGRQPYDWT